MVKHNHLAIGVLVVGHQTVGVAWYSTFLFGSPWVHAQGKQIQDLHPTALPFILAVIASILLCYVLSWFIQAIKVNTFKGGVGLGSLLWLGLGLPAIILHYGFLDLHWQIMAIDALHTLALSAVTGGVLAVWRRTPEATA